ncbi:MAG: cell division protein FtsQ/DivIB [Candidatus Omnitrophota bacterium]
MKKNNFKKSGKVSSQFNPFFAWIGASLVLIVLALFCAIRILASNFFIVRQVRANITIEESIKTRLLGVSLFHLPAKNIYTYIRTIHPEYKEIHITKEFPSAVRIDIKTRKPFAQLTSQGFCLIDREGVITSDPSSRAFQNIILLEVADYHFRLRRGMRLKDPRLTAAVILSDELNKHKVFRKFPVTAINTTQPQSFYFMMGDTKVIIGKEEFSRKLYILENLLKEQLRGDLSLVEYIDLRYRKAYVGYRR